MKLHQEFIITYPLKQKEEWRQIEGYGGYYEVSNIGRVRSMSRSLETFPAKRQRPYKRHYDAKIKAIQMRSNGYLCVSLCGIGAQRMFSVHRLVATAFIENPNNLPQVNHKDGNKKNNCVENLEWCNGSHNRLHANRMGLNKGRVGHTNEKCPASKKFEQYSLDGKLIKIWPSAMEAKRQLGISNYGICCSASGKQLTSGGFIWKYHKTA